MSERGPHEEYAEYLLSFETPAGTLYIPHFTRIALALMSGFIITWFSGLNRVILGIRDIIADLVLAAFHPLETTSRRVWTEPTEALADAWQIAAVSVGDDAFSFVMAMVVVGLFFWLSYIVIQRQLLEGGD